MHKLNPRTARNMLAVYRVSLDLGTHREPLLVGVCLLVKVFDLADARRRQGWQKATDGGHDVWVEILHTTLSAAEAEATALLHVAATSPRPHLQDDPFIQIATTAKQDVVCVESGERWPSLTALATELGVSVTAVSKHLSNKQPTLQGRTYRKA